MEDIRIITGQLKAWFPAEAHKERDLPGGGKWFFIPWQLIRDRLDEVCPEWQVSYSEPAYLGDYCTISCTITIAGISKQGVGNAQILMLSSSGKDMSRGTPVERATADAFKNAAETWGVARYLDEQTDPKTKAAFIKYMQDRGDGRAARNYHQNEGNTPARSPQRPKQAKPFGGGNTIDPEQPSRALQVVPTPAAEPPVDSANIKRLRAFTKQLGLEGKPGDTLIKGAIAQLNPGKKTSDLDENELIKVRDRVALNWAGGLFEDIPATSILQWYLPIESRGGEDEAIAANWYALVTQKKIEQA